jgi:murein tripeptide amidase MpaA
VGSVLIWAGGLVLSVISGFWGGEARGQAADPRVRYDGYKVIRLTERTLRTVGTMEALGASQYDCHGGIDWLVSPEVLAEVEAAGIGHQLYIADVQGLIDAEWAHIQQTNQQRGLSWFADYKDYDQYSQFVDELVAQWPALASRFTVGQSLEGRTVFGIRITSTVGSNKPAIFLNGMQHAREWVTGMTCMYIADGLLSGYGSDTQITRLLDSYEFLIVPIVNPDGYVYTWTTNRLWRKNRRNNGDGTFGVDTNRNWGYQWGQLPQGGSSGTPSSETYRGTAAFSEPETAILRDWISARPQILMTDDVHSYSQLLLSPWGYTDALPPDAVVFDVMNAGMEAAIESVHGLNYTGGPTFTTIYPANGVAGDWAYGARNVLGWGMELRDTGNFGFQLPADQIIPNAEEIFAGIRWAGDWLLENPLAFEVNPPTTVQPDVTTQITFSVTRAGQFPDSESVQLYSRIGTTGAFTSTSAVDLGGNRYQATLPAAACGEVVQFYVQASSTLGTTATYPAGGASAPLTTTAVPMVTVLADDLEAAGAWMAGVPGDTATAGLWTRGNPNGTAAQPEDDHTPAPGVNCYFTGQGTPGGGVGAADVDGGRTTLVTPTIDLGGTSQARIGYWRWYSNSAGSSPNQDVFVVDVSNDGGGTWTRVETVGPAGPETAGGWYYHEFQVSGIVPPSSNVKLRFIAEDAGSGSIIEAAVDDLIATDTVPCGPACPADWNESGAVDSQDFFDFLAAFFAGSADFNNSGGTDSQDFFDFLAAFFQGC